MGAGQAHTIEVAAGEQLDAAAVEAALAQGDVVVRFEDPGEVVFNSTLAWSSGYALAIEAPGTIMVDAGASISAPGARVSLEAENIALLDESIIDVSAPADPGAIYVGGGWQGVDPALRNATAVYVAQGATLNADATASGQGGTVVCWAEDVMNFHGAITARGITAGGSAEVSGGQHLAYTGWADLRASAGPAGQLLLDPDDITISNAGTSGVTNDGLGLFTALSDGDNYLYVGDLTDQLALSAVQVQTLTGDISVAAAITWSTGNSLTLASGNSISVDASISNAGADLDLDAAVAVTVDSGAVITAAAMAVTNGSASSIDGVIAGATTLAANGPGTLTLTGPNTFTGETVVNAGTLALSGTGIISESSAVMLLAPGATFDISGSSYTQIVIQDLAGVAGTTVDLDGKTMYVGTATNTTFAGSLTGVGGLFKQGTGTLTLSGNNTYSGTTYVSAGELEFDAAYTVATGATMTVYAGATLTNNAVLLVSGSLTNSGTVNNTTGLIVVAPGATVTGLDLLTFDANGGLDTYTYAEPDTSFDLDKLTFFGMDPVRSGYVLLGWFDDPTNGTEAISPYTFTTGDTLWARWGELPTITTTSLPDGNVGTSYSQTLAATGDTPITWSLAGGTLPAGLTLSAAGVISGTPTTTGTSTFTVMATNTNGDDTATLSITVGPPIYQVIMVTTPGVIATASPTSATAGTTINLHTLPAPGSSFVRWEVSPAVTWTSGSATSETAAFTMPASDVTVTPVFKAFFGPLTDAKVSPTKASFDFNQASIGHSAIQVTLDPGSYTLVAIRCGGYTLQEGKDYTVGAAPTAVGATVLAAGPATYTILPAFLASLPVGTHTITFVMSGGVNPTLTVTITDTTPSTVVPITGDTTNPQGWAIALWSTLIGAFVTLLWRRRRQLRGTW